MRVNRYAYKDVKGAKTMQVLNRIKCLVARFYMAFLMFKKDMYNALKLHLGDVMLDKMMNGL